MKESRFPRITICIATYRRDDGLESLLSAIAVARKTYPKAYVNIIVIDNYGNGAAKDICRKFEGISDIPVRYFLESKRGISFARNRALLELPSSSEYVAFLDDDEVVHPNWLQSMIDAIGEFPADVWNGPVSPRYPPFTPDWIIRGRFFARPSRKNGEVRDRANTGNVLFRKSVIDQVKPWFSPDLALSGGEDTDYFNRVHLAGFRIVWVEGAEVFEFVDPTRLNLRWILRLHFVRAAAKSRTQFAGRRSGVNLGTLGIKVSYRLIQGIIFLPLLCFAPIRLDVAVNALLPFVWAAGTTAGAFGVKSNRY